MLNSNPTVTDAKYETPINAKFRFHFRIFFNKTTKPIPAFAHKPAAHEPKVMPPAKKVSVITTLDAQLGIKPMAQVKKGCKKRLRCINAANASSPTECTIAVKAKLTRKINNATFKVCQMGNSKYFFQTESASCERPHAHFTSTSFSSKY